MPDAPVTAPPLFASVAELTAGATERTGLDEGPGKSGARLERLVIGGQPYVLKRLDLAEDWTMRASGCLPGAPLLAWERGILARLPRVSTSRSWGWLRKPATADGPRADVPC